MGLLGAILDSYSYSGCRVGSGSNYKGVSTGYLNHPHHSYGYGGGSLCVENCELKPFLETDSCYREVYEEAYKNAEKCVSRWEGQLQVARIKYHEASERYYSFFVWNKKRRKEDMSFWEERTRICEKNISFWKEAMAFWSCR